MNDKTTGMDRSRAYRSEHLEAGRAYAKRYRAEHKEEIAAKAKIRRKTPREKSRHMLNASVRNGKTIKPDRCQECNAAVPLHGHHHDYGQPLNVTWLCQPCHIRVHRTFTPKDGVAIPMKGGAALRDLSGQRFGKLVARSRVGKSKRVIWLCDCDCGKQSTVISQNLIKGKTQSCGCGRFKTFTKSTEP